MTGLSQTSMRVRRRKKATQWTIAQVKSIMKDETYIGHTIHYRETNISFKNKRRIRKPQSEWVRVENTQEPIISGTCFPAGTGADSKPPAGTQKRYDTDFCGTDKVCGLRLVAGLRREQAEQQALWLLSL